jgi:hypothetical protein
MTFDELLSPGHFQFRTQTYIVSTFEAYDSHKQCAL